MILFPFLKKSVLTKRISPTANTSMMSTRVSDQTCLHFYFEAVQDVLADVDDEPLILVGKATEAKRTRLSQVWNKSHKPIDQKQILSH